MKEEFYYGVKKIAARLGIGEAKARKWCREGIIIAHQERGEGQKKTWWCSESDIIKTIRERFPAKL